MNGRGCYSVENAKQFAWSSVTGELHAERVAHLQRYLVGKKILDAGCGGGAYTKYLAQNGWEVTGLERSEQFLALASAAHPSGTYMRGDVTEIPFGDDTFDTVLCFDVVEHVADEQDAVRELCRVSAQRVLLTVPAHDENVVGHGLTFRHYQDLTHLRTYTEDSLATLLRAVGQTDFQILPELPVDLQGLASAHLVPLSPESGWQSAKTKGLNFLLRRLLARAAYRDIYSGWLAVVNL